MPDPEAQKRYQRSSGRIVVGVIVLLMALGALSNFLGGGQSANPSFALGGLLMFGLMVWFGIWLIRGKRAKN